jgi:hypothetical protein
MKKKPTSNYYHVMQKLAEKLTPAATVACLLVDNPTHYAEPLINTLCPVPTPDQIPSDEPKMKTKVLLIHRNQADIGRMRLALQRYHVSYEAKHIEQFTQENIRVRISDIQGELDGATLRSYKEFKDIVTALPEALRRI